MPPVSADLLESVRWEVICALRVRDGEVSLALTVHLWVEMVCGSVSSHSGAHAVFPFPSATPVMEQVVLIPPEHFAGCCSCMENVRMLVWARRGPRPAHLRALQG